MAVYILLMDEPLLIMREPEKFSEEENYIYINIYIIFTDTSN